MKKTFFIFLAALVSIGASAQSNTYNWLFNAGRTIPDADPSGTALATNLTGMTGIIGNVDVSLNISGGYNGDLYAYLAGPGGGFAVLLNRVGVSNNASAFGYNDAAMNVTLSGLSGSDVHFYQSVSYSLSGGQLTGTWNPDGRNMDPQSSPGLFPTTPQTALLSSFNNVSPNGAWTLFLADFGDGGQGQLVTWGLTISTIPEPGTIALFGLGLLAILRLAPRRKLIR